MTPNLTGKQRSNLTQKVSLIYFQNLNLIHNPTKVNKLAKQEIKTQINKIRKHPKPSKSEVGRGLGIGHRLRFGPLLTPVISQELDAA